MTTLQFSSDNPQLKHLMKALRRDDRSRARRIASVVVIMAALVSLTACGSTMRLLHGTGAKRPAATEFGLGPRASANRLYVATLETETQLRTRRLQTLRVGIVDADGRAVGGATLAFDGGMPEHGHGLPTRPRMTRVVDAGTYAIRPTGSPTIRARPGLASACSSTAKFGQPYREYCARGPVCDARGGARPLQSRAGGTGGAL